MKILRISLFLSGIILLVWFSLPLCMFGILNAGNIAGISFSAILILYGFTLKKVNKYIYKLWQKRYGKMLLSFLLLISISVISFVIFATFKITGAFYNKPEKETTVVVLGCQVKAYGPSLMLTERLEAAYKYLNENEDLKCVLSGGQGANEPVSEAECMYNWLADKGIDKNRLYIEDNSTSTVENLTFSKRLIEENGLIPEITVITNEFHQYRANQIAKSLDMESYNVSGKTQFFLFPAYFVREIGGVLYEYLKGMI